MPLDVSRIRKELPERRIHYFASTTTTMAEGAKLAASGAPEGTVVLAEKQTAGRGRMGRAWYSEADAGLYLTIILRPTRTVPWLTLAVGLALHEVVSGVVADASRVDIRWPNDVLLDGRKCAGILVTADGEAVLIGIGVNVNHGEFPDDLAGLATSILVATGAKASREDLLISLLRAADDYLMLPADEIRRRFQAVSSYVQGLEVEIEDMALRGVTCGLDAEGFLLVRMASGEVERIVAGGVRPVRPPASATIPILDIED